MILEAAIASKMGLPKDAVAIVERVMAVFTNDYVENLLKKYQQEVAAVGGE